MDESEATDALVERLGRLDGLSEILDNLRAEVVGLRSDLTRKPSHRESEYKRRRLAFFLVAYTIVVIFMHDQHVEHCGPGTRISAVAPAGCDVFFPLHGHETAYPNSQTLLGIALYASALAAMWAWVTLPMRRRRRRRTDVRD